MNSSYPECIATLGPASMHLCRELREAGATAFRLNTSHMTLEAVRQALDSLQRLVPRPPVWLDLQGAKMRLGLFEQRLVRPGDVVRLGLVSGEGDAVPLPHPEVFGQVQAGETLRLDDDRVRLEVLRVDPGIIQTRVVQGGLLRPRKGINVSEHPVRLCDLSPFDSEVCSMAVRHPGAGLALSFVEDGGEAQWVRRRASGCALAGKIERRESAQAITEVAAAFDSLWICRGDLGSQMGLPEMAAWIHRLDPRSLGCPVLMAGQVFQQLTEHAQPTRSEACHLYDLVVRGYSGIVLSDETAVGVDPVRATLVARGLLNQMRYKASSTMR